MTTLPQHADPMQSQVRSAELAAMRLLYEWDHDSVKGSATCKNVPPPEFPSPAFVAQRLARGAELMANSRVVSLEERFDPFDSLDDYAKLFPVIGAPHRIIDTYLRDDVFAYQRLAGFNPMTLRLCLELPPGSPLLQAAVQLPGAMTLVDAVKAGRIYIENYSILKGTPLGTSNGMPKFMLAPIALFYLQDVGLSGVHSLTPIAIQMDQDSTVVRTPHGDQKAWTIAKMVVQTAAANHHEMGPHLWGCHFGMEPWAVAMHRNLAPSHPLNILLKPHFENLIANNELGRKQLVNEGGPVDSLMAPTLAGSLELLRRFHDGWFWSDTIFHGELHRRGFDLLTGPTDHPYKDDGTLVWTAIHGFVDAYVGLYYKSEADVEGDTELRGWLAEVGTQGLIEGVPVFADLWSGQRLGVLVDTITQLIFTAGPQHSAVNFTQAEFMMYAPNCPVAAYADPMTETDVLKLLPPKDQAMQQVEILGFLAAKPIGRLGYYAKPFADPAAEALAEAFRKDLAEVDATIDVRNSKRLLPYGVMQPKNIPNSTNV